MSITRNNVVLVPETGPEKNRLGDFRYFRFIRPRVVT